MIPSRRWPIAVLLLLLLSAAPAFAAVNRWTPIGPPGAYGFTRIHFDPLQEWVAYAEIELAGIWRSGNYGAASWHPLTLPQAGQPIAFAVYPHHAGVLFVAFRTEERRAALWSTVDSGTNWFQVSVLPLSKLDSELIPDPNVAGTLYWLTGNDVYRSTDGGLTFQCFPVGVPDCAASPRASALAIAPGRPTLYATGFLTSLRSDDGGESWSSWPLTVFGSSYPVDRLAPTSDPGVLYAWISINFLLGGDRPCFARTSDGGETWTGYLAGERCGEPAIDPREPNTVRIVVREGDGRPHLWTSHDGGETWTKTAAPLLGSLFVGPGRPETLFLASPGGFLLSQDGGETWAPPLRAPQASHALFLEASPEAPGVLYLAARDPFGLAGDDTGWRLWKTTSSGGAWTALPLPKPEALAIDPSNPRHLIAAAARPGRQGAVSAIFESRDSGLTWKKLRSKLPPQTWFGGPPSVLRLAIDPSDPRRVYLGTSRGGFLKSLDGGYTWKAANQGLPLQTTCPFRFCPENRVDEIVFDSGDPRVLYVTFDHTVFRSSNRGETWEPANQGLPTSGVEAIEADPDAPGVLYAGVGAAQSPLDQPGKVYRSVDGGRSWTALAPLPVLSIPLMFGFGVVDLRITPAGLFVATGTHGVLRSVDDGQTWTAVQAGLALPFVSLLEPDPFAPDRLYAGTRTHGAYVARFP